MKRPAIFFDRDNTLIACDGYLGDPDKVVLVEGAADAVARARKLGYATVVFSNQSGVARGMFDERAVEAVNARLDELLRQQNPDAILDRHEFCPFHPEGLVEEYRKESPLRKPAPGMVYRAAESLALDLSRSWVIGDAPRDVEAGHAAGCRTILFCDPQLRASSAALSALKVQPEYCVTTLKEAMDYIEQSAESKEHEAPATHTPGAASTPSPRMEAIANEILQELRRRREQPSEDFSVSKLLAGVTQMLVLAVLLGALLYRNDERLISIMLLALVLQTMTIALLIMGRQR